MRAMINRMLWVLVVGAMGEAAYGDGKFFVREKVPADLPYQRAFLTFFNGYETLLVQSKYELAKPADVNSLGWVVPVPAVPEVASVRADVASWFFSATGRRTQPRPVHVSDMLSLSGIVLFFAGVVLCIPWCTPYVVEYLFPGRMRLPRLAGGRLARIAAVLMVGGLLLAIITGGRAGRMAAGGPPVEVVKAQQAGIYDVKVIRADTAEAITSWLRDNGFNFGQADTDVLQDYVRRGWCFVTAKVGPDSQASDRKVVTDGLVAPLILRFPVEKPIYPLALTATAGSATEILLYTLTEKKLSCGERLKLRNARHSGAQVEILADALAQSQSSVLFTAVHPDKRMLCKFKWRLTAEQMRQDLEFGPALDDEPYAERTIVW
jgi:hypothetical protein